MLLANDGALPLRRPRRIAVIGPLADDAARRCSAATPSRSHVASQHPDAAARRRGPDPARRAARRAAGRRGHARGAAATVDAGDGRGIAEAVPRPRGGRRLRRRRSATAPASSAGAPRARAATPPTCACRACRASCSRRCSPPARPVVLVLLTGRPYALGALGDRLAAVVQAFFPGEEGGPAVAGVLTGRVNPSGRLPVSVPRRRAASLRRTCTPPLGQRGEVSNVDPTPLYPFGHGLSYTAFAWEDAAWTRDRARPVIRRTATAVSRDRAQHRRPGRGRGRPALPARPGGPGDPPGRAADRLRPGGAGAGRGAAGAFPFHADLPRSRVAAGPASSSRAPWSCG